MKNSSTTPRQFLAFEIQERKLRNTRLSLRHLAITAGVNASSLTRVLNGSRQITPALAIRIARALNFGTEEIQHLLDLISIERSKDQKQRQKIVDQINRKKIPTSKKISIENFRIIADWEHFAILSLTKTKKFKANPIWIADRLGISVSKVNAAVERLQALNLLVSKGKSYTAVEDANIETPQNISESYVRENHRQHLQKAIDALKIFTPNQREFCNLSVVMNYSHLPEAKKRLRIFFDEFNRDFDQAGMDEVFQLNVQLYPLTKSKVETM
ncbi:MAG: TIGR02147 family protein [Bdellovibrionota bacterium]